MDTDRFIESVNKKRESAWREMYRKYYPAMCNYASKIVKDDCSGLFYQDMGFRYAIS